MSIIFFPVFNTLNIYLLIVMYYLDLNRFVYLDSSLIALMYVNF